MSRVSPSVESEDKRIVLGVLTSVDDGATSQRHIAAELGVALGLVNAYLRRCVKKGLVKVREVPSRRYAYYLTPYGFNEKSRLTMEYLSSSFSFFRQAKADCVEIFAIAESRNFQNLVLLGRSDLAEIAILSSVESHISIVAVVDADGGGSSFVGKPVVSALNEIPAMIDAVIITELRDSRQAFESALKAYGFHRVLAPKLLGLNHTAAQAGAL